ncbi:MAG: choice-of-anchor J domain-containing protein [Negativicutes bacterium]|nr:choice-of-anchor J domain-containing protein [Negativicutes bacterium]
MKPNARVLVLGLFTACLSIFGVARAQTVVWSENFDDGNANARWNVDFGVWQIGTPTTGPAAGDRTHSGPYCATTGLTADYPVSMNSRLIRNQTFTVPAASQFPRLRFWHWYSFTIWSGDDYGVVEIKVGANAWQAISPHYTGDSGDWTCAAIDLSPFAGQTVQLAFHAVDVNGAYPDVGWYVDDISLVTGTPVLNNPEGFETGIGDWYADQGTWRVGSATKSDGPTKDAVGAQAHTGHNCAVTVLNADYPLTMNSRFISPPFILPPASASPYLRFWHWYSFTTWASSDYGVVEIRVGTSAWQAISPQYTNNSANWTEPKIDLTRFGGQTVQLAFHAVDTNDKYPAAGWYVDDVQIFPSNMPVGPTNIVSSIPSTNIDILALWEYTPIIDGTGYTFGLSNAPSGMTVDPSSGTISWTPTWEQAANDTYTNITYMVYQSGALAASTNFNVTVTDVGVSSIATATSVVTNGYLVEATLTYGGFGYTNTPGVRFIGGGGSGAEGVCVVSNGMVIGVDISNPGSGYSSAPIVVIAPPFIPKPAMGIVALSFLSFTNLVVGTSYQFQFDLGGTLINIGPSFSATNTTFTQYVSGTVGPNDYQLATEPVPAQATASPEVVGGFVVGATVTSGGSGYAAPPAAPPAVTISGDGINATAIVQVSEGGVVTNISITNPGSGYTDASMTIAPPPETILSPNVTQVMELDLESLSPYDNYQLEFVPVLNGDLSNLGTPFTPTETTNTQYINVTGSAGFFRVQWLGH